jgi:hypothetical protein
MPMTIVPFDEALAAVDGPDAVAARKKQADADADAKALADSYREWERPLTLASVGDLNTIYDAFRTDYAGTQTDRWRAEAQRKAYHAAHAVVAKQIEIQLLAAAISAVYNDPDRYEDGRIRQAYNRQVSAVAWAQGSKEPKFVATFEELIAGSAPLQRPVPWRGERSSRRLADVGPGCAR